MKSQFKLGLYVVTVVGTLVFGNLFLRNWRLANGPSEPARAVEAKPSPAKKTPAKEAKAGSGASQVAAARGATSEVASATDSTNSTAAGAVTNAAESAAGGAGEISPTEPTAEQEAVPMQSSAVKGTGLGKLILYGLLAVGFLVGLGFLLAYDVAHYAGRQATEILFDDRGGDAGDSDYEAIEKVYGTGDYLETVRLLREFLKENPRALHAQLRIAEIYEKDLNNPLASALEYEELLKLPLEPTRWGWNAIHLVNLYNRLEKPKQAVALMQSILVKCPDTPAAGKARERLEAMGEEAPEPPAPSEPDPGSGGGGLPPGFKPKR